MTCAHLREGSTKYMKVLGLADCRTASLDSMTRSSRSPQLAFLAFLMSLTKGQHRCSSCGMNKQVEASRTHAKKTKDSDPGPEDQIKIDQASKRMQKAWGKLSVLQFLFGGTCSEQQGCKRLQTSLRMKFSAARCCKNGFLRPALEVLLLLGAESFATSRMTRMDATHLRRICDSRQREMTGNSRLGFRLHNHEPCKPSASSASKHRRSLSTSLQWW